METSKNLIRKRGEESRVRVRLKEVVLLLPSINRPLIAPKQDVQIRTCAVALNSQHMLLVSQHILLHISVFVMSSYQLSQFKRK